MEKQRNNILVGATLILVTTGLVFVAVFGLLKTNDLEYDFDNSTAYSWKKGSVKYSLQVMNILIKAYDKGKPG